MMGNKVLIYMMGNKVLIYMMGNKAEDMLRSFGLNDEDKEVQYKVVRNRYEMSFTSVPSLTYRNRTMEKTCC